MGVFGHISDPHFDGSTARRLDGSTARRRAGRPAGVHRLHHPPAALHSPEIDAIRQFGSDRLAEVVAGHPNVAAIVCGHAHTPAATTFAGRPLLVAPGIASTLRLPWEGADADDFIDDRLPPALAFHVTDDHGRLATHYRVVT